MRSLHQHQQRPAVEFGLFDLACDRPAVGGDVGSPRIVPFGGFPAHPVGALQALGRASVSDHPSVPEGIAHGADQALSLGLASGQLADRLQQSADCRDQDVNGVGLSGAGAMRQLVDALRVERRVFGVAHGLVSKLWRMA